MKKILFLKMITLHFKNKSSKFEEEILSEISLVYEKVIKKYDKSFQTFLARNIDRSKMTSIIYGISRNGRKELVMCLKSYFKIKGKHKNSLFPFLLCTYTK